MAFRITNRYYAPPKHTQEKWKDDFKSKRIAKERPRLHKQHYMTFANPSILRASFWLVTNQTNSLVAGFFAAKSRFFINLHSWKLSLFQIIFVGLPNARNITPLLCSDALHPCRPQICHFFSTEIFSAQIFLHIDLEQKRHKLHFFSTDINRDIRDKWELSTLELSLNSLTRLLLHSPHLCQLIQVTGTIWEVFQIFTVFGKENVYNRSNCFCQNIFMMTHDSKPDGKN